MRTQKLMKIDSQGDIIAGICDTKLIVYKIKNLKLEQQKEWVLSFSFCSHETVFVEILVLISFRLEHPHQLARLTFSPLGDYVVTGDVNGMITQWFCLDDQIASSNPLTVHKHWHAHEVLSLAFNQEGL